MFESHRKFKTCILCGRHDLTKEHIFGKSFAAYLNVTHNWKAKATPWPFPVSDQEVKGSSPITNIAPKLLCAKCNIERLSGLMNDSLPYLKDLSAGNPIALLPGAAELTKRYFERILLIVDVCTSNEQLTSKHKRSREHQLTAGLRQRPAIMDFVQRREWLMGGPLTGISVYIGHHTGVLGLNPDVNITYGTVANGGVMRPTKRIQMVIKELAVCLDIGRPDSPPSSFVSIDSITKWPIDPKVSYDDYFSLRHQDQNAQMLRYALLNAQFVSELEHLSRAKGSFTIPDRWR
jgi:hypothetical protein